MVVAPMLALQQKAAVSITCVVTVNCSASSAGPNKFFRPETVFYWFLSSLTFLSLSPIPTHLQAITIIP